MSGFTQSYETIIVAHARAISFSLGIIAIALLLGLIAHSTFFAIIRYVGKRRESVLYSSFSARMRNASLLFMLLFSLNIAVPLIKPIVDSWKYLDIALSIPRTLVIVSVAWLLDRKSVV